MALSGVRGEAASNLALYGIAVAANDIVAQSSAVIELTGEATAGARVAMPPSVARTRSDGYASRTRQSGAFSRIVASETDTRIAVSSGMSRIVAGKREARTG